MQTSKGETIPLVTTNSNDASRNDELEYTLENKNSNVQTR